MQTAARTAILASILAALVSGCSAINEQHQSYAGRKVDIVPVVGSIWRISAEWPNFESAPRIADYIYERAQRFCNDKKLGMMPGQGSSRAASEDGKPAYAWLEFRCTNPDKTIEREYKPITLHFELEDEEEDGRRRKSNK
ncbi:hypothetical protein [Sutterella sp.]|uniref:hypothetical protein n=1 Tax=Sutterella sp. TaxID=1981025 RepID=UPI0026DED067|nr:hypothetical protein [Sutterella sp.]MDO5531706.1 hypothetical protein [Sutterella sp.]